MTDYSYTLFDTAVFSNSVLGEIPLFQVSQGGDATHTKDFTNSRGAGQVPQQESFLVNRVGIRYDMNVVTADAINVWLKSYFQLIVSDDIKLYIPSYLAAEGNDFGGHYTESAASNEALIGLVGRGYELPIPIEIPGGTSFRAIINQGTALSTTSLQVKVCLHGTLTR